MIDGENVTMSDEHMWLVPYTDGETHLLQINFPRPQAMCGVRLWNYNKSAEDTYRGVSQRRVFIARSFTEALDDAWLVRE